MKYLDEFRDPELAKLLVARLKKEASRPLRIMEVCGTHTMAIFRNGIRAILPEQFELISGPGCPVCVTSAPHLDAFLSLAHRPNTRLAIFGDLFRVPGSKDSLAEASGRGAKVNIVYSPMDALILAQKHPEDTVVFLGVGFETTTPSIAATILAAKNEKVHNFTVFSTHKLMPPTLMALLDDPDLQLDGLLCPGHVSAIIGAGAYQPMVDKYKLACVVAGFETLDLLYGLLLLARQIGEGKPRVENSYGRAVRWEANGRAEKMVNLIMKPVDSQWRGLGVIGQSGLAIRPEYEDFDAEKRFNITLPKSPEPKACLCGEILKGIKNPLQCPLFDDHCSPSNPVGPCMVSSEGTCAAYYKYGRFE